MPEAVEKTVEIAEPEVTTETKVPTVEDVKAAGWSAKEIELAEKRGMVRKPEEKKEEKRGPESVGKPVDGEKAPEEPKTGEDLDAMVKAGVDLSPDQEREFLKNRPPGNQDRAFYFRSINERKTRQKFQRELEQERADRAKEKAAFESRLAALEGKKEPLLDENGNEIDPEDKPLTLKQLKEIEKAKEEDFNKKREEMRARAQNVADAQKSQEEYARGIYPDFDDTAKLAAEVMQNLEKMVPEKWKQAKAKKLMEDLQITGANADQIDLDGYHAAVIAHEIGQLHPSYGKKNGEQPSSEEREALKDPKANGGHTPEQMKRIEKNTQRGASSASIPGGGGRRTVSADEVTLSDLNKMNYEDRQSFRSKHPEQYAKLLRG